ncbi:hypothetical protein [Pelagicoccus mobilis]|uniref:Sulfotransferase family protein n=1 Tax=Pelagicoccus mobilis TaxID=415221 RepID=A0A934VSV6_9BACT|nr:hypothetical protein [Pelagicoccus mobilis]MBK1879410.1 hypothetical protein [Pelagicoccus mobilis]
MKLVIHPGFPKCGSSAIQTCLYDNWRTLRDEGIALPDKDFKSPYDSTYPDKALGPALLFHYLAEGSDPEEYRRQLDTFIESARSNKAHTVVVSAENLANFGPGYELALNELASRFQEIELVMYIRKQDDFFLSAWTQWIYHQGQSFDSFVEERLNSLYPNYDTNVERVLNSFPTCQAKVIPLVREALKGGSLIDDFLDKIGSKLTIEKQDYAATNRSLNPYLCEALSKVGRLQKEPFSNRLRVLLERYADEEILFRKHPEFASYSTRTRILDAFEPSNRSLHKRWFPEIDFDSVFSVDPSLQTIESEEPNIRRERQAEALQFFADLCVRLFSEVQ